MFCSAWCRDHRPHARRQPVATLCRGCGRSFYPLTGGRRYCSPECSTQRFGESDCPVCWGRFWKTSPSQQCCSAHCGMRKRRETLAQARGTHPCPTCGKATDRPLYCSRQCSWTAHKRSYRVAKRGNSFEKVDAHLIYDRDRWRCHLCGKKVLPKYRGPDPRSASLDHLIPISKGGAHAMVNVALAHYGCNSARGSGGTCQLILIA